MEKISANIAGDLGSIVIDIPKFKKISKKIKDKLNQDYEVDLKLSEVNEILSSSMGFRNYNALQQKLTSNNNNNISEVEAISITSDNESNVLGKKNYLEQLYPKKPFVKLSPSVMRYESESRVNKLLSSHNLESIMTLFLNNSDLSMCASNLASVVMILINTRDNEETILDVNFIREHLMLDVIIKMNKRKDLPTSVKTSLRDYLCSLPGFQENSIKQSDTVVEQHGYLQMQFSSILKLLDKVKNNDFILVSKRWCWESNNEFTFKRDILNSDSYDDSWLKMTGTNHCLIDLKINNKENYYFSDLLVLFSKVINTTKIKELDELIRCLSKKYDESVRLSEHFQSL